MGVKLKFYINEREDIILLGCLEFKTAIILSSSPRTRAIYEELSISKGWRKSFFREIEINRISEYKIISNRITDKLEELWKYYNI